MSGPAPISDVLDYAAPGHTRIARPPRPPVVRIVVFGLLLFPLLLLAFYPIARLLPVGWWTVAVTQVPTNRKTAYGQTAAFHVGAHGAGRGASVPMASGTISYTGELRFWMTTDLRDLTCRPISGIGGANAPFPLTSNTLRRELEKSGFDATSGEAADLATAIMAEVQKLPAGQLPQFDATRGGATAPPAYRLSYMVGERWPRYLVWWPWYTPWCIPLWLAAWVLAARWLLVRHRRKLGSGAGGFTLPTLAMTSASGRGEEMAAAVPGGC